METFDSDISHFDPRNKFAGDEKLPVQFYMGTLPDDAATTREGRPIFRDIECIKIYNSKDNVIDRPVRDTDKQRWPGAYNAWKLSGASEPGASGTRLEHWPQMTRAQVEEYKYFKVFTVEQLAELPDTTVQKIMGAPQLRQKARLYVEAAKSEAPLLAMQQELDKRDGKIAQLEAEVARLAKLIEQKMGVPA
jgi:hypothetical protein